MSVRSNFIPTKNIMNIRPKLEKAFNRFMLKGSKRYDLIIGSPRKTPTNKEPRTLGSCMPSKNSLNR